MHICWIWMDKLRPCLRCRRHWLGKGHRGPRHERQEHHFSHTTTRQRCGVSFAVNCLSLHYRLYTSLFYCYFLDLSRPLPRIPTVMKQTRFVPVGCPATGSDLLATSGEMFVYGTRATVLFDMATFSMAQLSCAHEVSLTYRMLLLISPRVSHVVTDRSHLLPHLRCTSIHSPSITQSHHCLPFFIPLSHTLSRNLKRLQPGILKMRAPLRQQAKTTV